MVTKMTSTLSAIERHCISKTLRTRLQARRLAAFLADCFPLPVTPALPAVVALVPVVVLKDCVSWRNQLFM